MPEINHWSVSHIIRFVWNNDITVRKVRNRSLVMFEIDNVPYPSQTEYNERKAKKGSHGVTGWPKCEKSKGCDR